MGAPATDQDVGTSDEIKEFKYEGDSIANKDGLVDIKNALGMAADCPPLTSALEYFVQLKGVKAGISPLVIEVANRIKQEQLQNANRAANNTSSYPNNHQSSLNHPTAIYGTSQAPKLGDFPSICLPGPVPNVNAVSLSTSSAYPRPTWTTPMLITSTQSTLQQRTHPLSGGYPHYYNQHHPAFHYSQHFGQNQLQAGQHLQQAQQPQPQPAQPQPATKTKGGKGKKKSSHIKKPLNAFMLYMKEMRAKVVQEYTLKESAAINQILGKRWHALDRSEQARFYEMARRERALHMQMYPNWSARSNYAATNKKKRKRDKNTEQDAGSPKKCRARYGLDKQSSWCKPCRRKKKCVRYLQGEDADCKDGKCDADGDNHKPSCPAAHEPTCSARGSSGSCDCNTHTCGFDNGKKASKTDETIKKEEKDCTCRKEEEGSKEKIMKTEKTEGLSFMNTAKPPNVVIKSPADQISVSRTQEGHAKDSTSLHLASVANLSLTRESPAVIASSYSLFGPQNCFRPQLYQPPPRIFPSHLQAPVAQPVMGEGVQVGYIPSTTTANTNVLSHLPYTMNHLPH